MLILDLFILKITNQLCIVSLCTLNLSADHNYRYHFKVAPTLQIKKNSFYFFKRLNKYFFFAMSTAKNT